MGSPRETMSATKKIRRFFLPRLTPGFLIRVCAIAVLAYLFFGHICLPLRIQGISMEPTYHDGSFNFCWTLRYLFSKPKREDIVAVRLAGKKVMLLKRVVGVEGQQVEFRDGKLFVDEKESNEPYVRGPCSWNLSPREVEKDCVYVIGDNRSMLMRYHDFGQVPIKRIAGAPLW